MRHLILSFLAGALLMGAPAKHTFVGVITDSECPSGDHSKMHMGSTDAECALACVDAHGAEYVLYDGKQSYRLSDQKMPEKFAGRRVKITGMLDPKTKQIQVDSIALAK